MYMHLLKQQLYEMSTVLEQRHTDARCAPSSCCSSACSGRGVKRARTSLKVIWVWFNRVLLGMGHTHFFRSHVSLEEEFDPPDDPWLNPLHITFHINLPLTLNPSARVRFIFLSNRFL